LCWFVLACAGFCWFVLACAGLCWFVLVVCGAVLLPHLLALVAPARPWSWKLGLLIFALALAQVVWTPICVPLMVYWLKPDNRAYFGVAQ